MKSDYIENGKVSENPVTIMIVYSALQYGTGCEGLQKFLKNLSMKLLKGK